MHANFSWRDTDREEACLPVQLLLTPLFADGWREQNGSKSLRTLLSEAGLLTEYVKRENGVNDELTNRLERICEEYAGSNGKEIKSMIKGYCTMHCFLDPFSGLTQRSIQ
ncbi:unnamed protein product [Anisakis simplex]|uniref:RING-type E3 ubiquitin transferase n=1 Tax=Anisakis simplex TaxID=6269 RepID=A0A0M3J325_ANISI|nr:unnamed protein product [Anisakis simplex]